MRCWNLIPTLQTELKNSKNEPYKRGFRRKRN